MPHVRPRAVPPTLAFTTAERRVVDRCRTPHQVQAWLNDLPYNSEQGGETQRSYRGVIRTGMAHCMEAAVSAAVILEQHGYPPLIVSFESIDRLDHVIYVYRTASGWGSVARSRDPGLHGRKPLFARPRDLALSYCDPYIDYTGQVTGYALIDLRELMNGYNWRLSERNLWAVEQALIDYPHRRIRSSRKRVAQLRARYRQYRAEHDDRKPLYYDRRRWTPIPKEFL
jgi:hypothetical protein